MAACSSWQCFLLAFLALGVTTVGQNVRRKRQIMQDQPRLLTENGDLIFQCGNNHNIYLRPSAGGGVYVGTDNLTYIAETVKRNKADIDTLKTTPTGIPSNVEARISSLETTVNGLQNMPTQISTLANTVNSLQITVTSTNANSRLLSVESRLDNLQPTGQVQTQLTSLSSLLNTLETRVSAIVTQLGDANSGLQRRVQTLETTVQSLQQLLTTNECQSNPCQNGGTCVDTYNGFFCQCPSNWQGVTCSADVNECAEYAGTAQGCQNGATCVNLQGSFRCDCTPNWYGILCTSAVNSCSGGSHEQLCGHGTCVDAPNTPGRANYRCICDNGWSTSGNSSDPACNTDVNECASSPCSADPPVQCINYPGGFRCGMCPTGYTGNGFGCTDINECETNNGGCSLSPRVDCVNTRGSRTCGPCPSGYQGDGVTCSWTGLCSNNNGGCHPLATCREVSGVFGVTCTCPSGYSGNGVGSNGCIASSSTGACASNPCQNGACAVSGTSYVCSCNPGYTGRNCDSDMNECTSSPCQNGGTCVNTAGSFRCDCTSDYTGSLCQDAQQGCGGYLNGERGSFSYPRVAGTNYTHGVSCAWQITTSNDKILMLTFPVFNIEYHTQCNFDFLQIHDGASASAHMIGRYCGNTPPNSGSINTTHNQVYFWFKSDASIAGSGFNVSWVSADPVCGGDLSNGSYGAVNSPGYPGNYPHNRDCAWTITVPPGNNILFTFAYLAIEHHPNCSYDYLEIRAGQLATSPLLQRYCGTPDTTPAPITVLGNYAYIRFHTDSSLNDRGFHITYSAVSTGIAGCGGAQNASEGTVSSPNYPSPYNHDAECVWIISVNTADNVVLTFSDFDLETSSSCQFDYVEVRDGRDETAILLGRFCGAANPTAVTSSGNVLFLKFRSDSSLNGRGFHASWTSGCGGTYTAPQGTIQSPSYPNNYPHNKQCNYLINQPEGSTITLTFNAFAVEGGSCSFDFVEVRNGGSADSPLLGSRFCGTSIPPVLQSTQNLMFIRFQTDGSVSNTGFRATYTAQAGSGAGCGGVLSAPQGNFTSPGHPNNYPHGANCTWSINVRPGLVITLTFNSFLLETGCQFDSVKIYDNATANPDSLLGTFCGTTIPPVITSTNNYLTIVFTSDASVARIGFSASYITQNATQACGRTLLDTTGVITSPGYPDNYPHGRNCTWTIVVPAGNQIRLNVTNFALESHSRCQYDYLQIRNGGYDTSPLVGTYCGRTIDSPIISHSNRMWLRFVSDNSMSASGFRIVYDGTTTGCGGDLTTPTGSIISPNYPSPYNHNSECFWTITVAQGSAVQITFDDFDVESISTCIYDYLEIRDNNANGPLLAKLCGNDIPVPVNSTSNVVWIKYHTDVSINGRGFSASYTTNCNNVLTAHSGAIESPNFPRPYFINSNCTWIIQTTAGNTVNISFSTFDLETHSACRYDYLELRDGGSATSALLGTGRYCGSTIPPAMASTTNQVWVKFLTDSSISGSGFHLDYVTNGCGGPLTGASGTFTSPNYPNSYNHAHTCEWTITVETGKAISLAIEDFDMENSVNCSYDALEIYMGSDDTGILINTLCHTQTSTQTVTSTGNTMFVRMRTDTSISGRGFRASYTAIDRGCGGNFSALSGVIFSKNYPSNYPHRTECEWLITLGINQPVILNFMDFDLEGGSCSYDSVKLYDGPDMNSTLIAQLCGRTLPNPVTYRASNNYMFIKMRSDGSVSGRGFKANYTAGCGGVKNATTDGEIFSPNYPDANYPRNSNCFWLITSSRNTDRITLTFTHMDVTDRNSCGADYVEVRNGNNANSSLVGRYCGQTVPTPITSSGSNLYISFVSSGFYTATGFRATYTTATASCGGDFTSLNGAFVSPSYPNSYPTSTECVWRIVAAPGNRIQVAFSVFNIESSSSCANDFLEVRASDSSGALLGRWCGTSPPTNLTVVNGLWIRFQSDAQSTGVGFSGVWTTAHGGDLTGDTGQVASPGYPQVYPNNGDFTWTITVSTGMQVRLNFQNMDVEVSPSGRCNYDFIRIRDGGLATSAEIGRYCGTLLPNPIISTSNQVRLEFITDGSAQRSGFLINWQATNEQPSPLPTGSTNSPVAGCGGNLVAASTPQGLQSPGYPNGYTNGLSCLWNIVAPPGHRVWVNITDIDLESHSSCNYDVVRIYDADSTSGTPVGSYCGRTGNAVPILSTTNVLSVQFTTDISISVKGFSLQFKSACGGRLTDLTGVITSLGYPANYPNNANCTWVVQATNGRTVSVTFNTTFNIPSNTDCSADYVQLLNGGNDAAPPLLPNGTTSGTGRYCGTQLPSPNRLETSGGLLYISFVSDGSGSGAGFGLFYTEVAVTCGGTLQLTSSVTSGYFMSPNYPNNYPHNVDCVWIITAPANERIQVDFVETFNIESNLQCRYDYIEFRDGSTESSSVIGERRCGTDHPSSALSTGNVMYARFRTDNSVTHAGFKVNYRIATCGGRINGANGTITSPNYPANYSNNADCLWYVNGPTGHYLTFTYNAFALEASASCSSDYVEVREYNETGTLLKRSCGPTLPQSFNSSDSYAVVHFVSNQNIAATGFSLSFRASVEECGGELTTPTATFTSPNYPGQYAHSRQCEWRITVQAGRRVRLTFSDFGLEDSRTCAWDYVEVKNGILDDSPVINRYCGSNVTDVIESSANTMTVRFRSDGSISNRGFSATYTSYDDATCGGFYTTTPLNITSPGYYDNGNYSNSLQCIWQVQNPARYNSSIKITIDDLTIENHQTCGYDFLEFREGPDGTGPIIEKFCGNNTIPAPVVTPVQQVWMRFRTDRTIVDRGFAVTFAFTTCGGVLTSPQGVLSSPNYPNDYDHNDACAWLISALDDQRIRLSFADFSVENHTNCRYDYLEIFNGGLPDSPSIGRFCGVTPPSSFVSQSNMIRLAFVTDKNMSARGFRATYTFETEACGGLFHNNDGYLTSPNYPSNYPANTECEWDINVQQGYIVKLQFNNVTFSLQNGDCSRDYVEVRDVLSNGTQVFGGRWCGNTAPSLFASSTNRFIVKFHSDATTSAPGFAANWTTDCGGLFTDTSGVIVSPGHPDNYINNLRCNYTIISPSPEHYVLLSFDNNYALEGGNNCPFDYIDVYGGNSSASPRLARFCGQTVPQQVESLGTMYIRFWTDSSVVYSGFKAYYRVEACGGVYTAPVGVVASPTYPNPYGHNSNCTWLITVTQTNIIALKFTAFGIEPHSSCAYDYVDVYDGSGISGARLIGRYCGTTAPDIIKTTGNVMQVNFVTDGSISSDGFSAVYWATYGPQHGCGGTLNQTSGRISSVDGDGNGNYENNLDCRWTVIVGENKLAVVNFTNFDLEFGPSSCPHDYVEVFDGLTTGDPSLGRFCGSSLPPSLLASSNVLLIVFGTDSTVVSRGFNITFGQQDALCGGTLTATQAAQNISSPGYPGSLSQAVRCRWTIDSGSDDRQVSLTLRDIGLAQDADCSQEYLELRDSPMGLLGRSIPYCGTVVPPTFDSLGRAVQVNYNMPGGSSSRGFLLSYMWADCNKNYASAYGRITSPGYPGVYPPNVNCSSTITAPTGTTVALYFTQFYIEPYPGCVYDYLEIRNGSGSGDVVGRLCGATIPDPVFVPSSVAYLNFKTDNSVQHVGYDISYTSTNQGLGCGGQLSGINGSLTSPGFPGNFSDVATCTWSISVPARRVIRLTFTYLAVPGEADCANNYVEVFDGPNNLSRTFGRFCDSQAGMLTTTSNSATVRLISTGSSPAPSFRIVYTS